MPTQVFQKAHNETAGTETLIRWVPGSPRLVHIDHTNSAEPAGGLSMAKFLSFNGLIKVPAIATLRQSMDTGMENDLLGLLYGTVEDHPSNVEARVFLFEALLSNGHDDAAISVANDILRLDPLNRKAREHLRKVGMASNGSSGTSTAAMQFTPVKIPSSESERSTLEEQFQRACKELSASASVLVDRHIDAYSQADFCRASQLRDIANICYGRFGKIFGNQPKSVRQLARELDGVPEGKRLDFVVEDFESTLRWIRTSVNTGDGDPRERLVKRRLALEAAISPAMERMVAEAFMHVEHEVLSKKYVNDETMLGDAVPDIPRASFLVTEDGYAWDMNELSQALIANGGVMRNPLSKELFAPDDVIRILAHPVGSKLRPMQFEQARLKKGARQDTIKQLQTLSSVLLADMSEDAAESRKAVDEFLVYVATLPEYERKVLDNLKVPGKDTHTGQVFDYTIGESVRDAKGNKTCFHKVGDFLRQASTWLSNQ